MDKTLIKQYKDILNDQNKNENDIQDFLEHHTRLIPLPIMENHGLNMNIVISKFKLGNECITDLAYLTKSSNLWRLVLIELENQHKRVFKGSEDKPEFSADFNTGRDQILSWRVYLNDNKEQVLRQIKNLLQPVQMAENPVFFEYVLIMGRDDNDGYTELTSKRRKHLANLMENDHIKVMSYDSLYRKCIDIWGVDSEKIVLSPCHEQGYRIKNLPEGRISTSMFSFLSPDMIKVSPEQEKKLIDDGYEIEEWKKGFSLYINRLSES